MLPLVSILSLRVSIVSVHGPLKLLNLYFNADPDPAFHSYADQDPQPQLEGSLSPVLMYFLKIGVFFLLSVLLYVFFTSSSRRSS